MSTFLFFMGVFVLAGVIWSLSIFIEGGFSIPRSCKNAAFREYKARTIQNLKDEEQDFIKWLDEAAIAADRAAFEQFKASKK